MVSTKSVTVSMLSVLLPLSHLILRQSSETGTMVIDSHPTIKMKQLSLGEAKLSASKEMPELGFKPGNHTPKAGLLNTHTSHAPAPPLPAVSYSSSFALPAILHEIHFYFVLCQFLTSLSL